jgi:isoamylase
LRKRHASLRRRHFLSGQPRNGSDLPDVVWHGTTTGDPPWDDPDARVLAFTLARARQDDDMLHVLINMDAEAKRFEIPAIEQCRWYTALDTGRASPTDLILPEDQIVLETFVLMRRSRSIQDARRSLTRRMSRGLHDGNRTASGRNECRRRSAWPRLVRVGERSG